MPSAGFQETASHTYQVSWRFGFRRGVTLERSAQLGLPAKSSARMRECAKRRNPKPARLRPLDQIVDRLGGAVGDPGAAPIHDRSMPATESAAQAAQFGRAVGIGELGEVGAGELRAVDAIETPEDSFRAPRQADLAAGIASGEQDSEPKVAASLKRSWAESTAALLPERGVFAAAVALGVVLGPSAHLVDPVVPKRITWTGSATWPTWGSATSKVRRHAPERSNTPQSMRSRHHGG